MLAEVKYPRSAIVCPPKCKLPSEATFTEIWSMFPGYDVTLKSGKVYIKKKKCRKSDCAKCAAPVQLHNRRGPRGRLCKHCWMNEIVDCNYCHQKTMREHRCIKLPAETKSAKGTFKLCHQCPGPGMYISANSFKRHVQRKHQQYLYQCDVCQFRYANQSDLNNHMRVHSSALTFECKHCDEKFRWQSQLSLHTATHSVARAAANVHVDLRATAAPVPVGLQATLAGMARIQPKSFRV